MILYRLLGRAASLPAPATVVERILRVLDAIGARSSYLALLKEQPPALDRLIDVCAISGFLARQIAEFPLLLDELIDANAFDELPSRGGFVRELEARTERLPADDPEREVEALRTFQKVAVFSTALADLTGRLPLMRVSDRLTDIAELIVQCCMDLAWQQMTKIHGVPLCGESREAARPVKVAVAGYGKLGGWELGYGSDLDLVFLHDSAGEYQQTDGARPIDNGVFFLRLGQRIVHLLTMHSAAGRLYEVDMRSAAQRQGRLSHDRDRCLRTVPAPRGLDLGASGAAARPGRGRRWRRCAGASRQVRTAVLCKAVRRDSLRKDVLEMRRRMRRELAQPDPARFDIKQDPGGIADIEFLVQYWVLGAAAGHPELVDAFGQYPPARGAGARRDRRCRNGVGGSRKPT